MSQENKKYEVGDIVKNPTMDLLDHYTAEWVDVGVVRITGVVEEDPCNDIPTITISVEDYIKLTNQEPTTKNDLALIHTEGLDEEIRCTMCTNYMKSDRGCDGSCVVNKDMYKAVMDAIEKRIQPTTKNDLGVDCVARQDVERFIEGFINEYTPEEELEFINLELDGLKHLPPATPQEPTDKKFTKAELDSIVKAINSGWELRVNEVLDKIRAEIDKIYEREGNSVDCLNALDELKWFINKYKAESEVEDGNEKI